MGCLAGLHAPAHAQLRSDDYAARADKACIELQEKWGAEAFQNYLRRPDIQIYRRQLAQFLTSEK